MIAGENHKTNTSENPTTEFESDEVPSGLAVNTAPNTNNQIIVGTPPTISTKRIIIVSGHLPANVPATAP